MKIAADKFFEYWQRGAEIYRRAKSEETPMGVDGFPMDCRWECTVSHFAFWQARGLYPMY